MADPTFEDVIEVAPEFASEDETRVEAFIAYAGLFVNDELWDTKTFFVWCLMTAHLLKMNSASGSSGPVTQHKVGDVSKSYGTASIAVGDLESTQYGNLISQLAKSLYTTPFVVA
jgi:hypothetical protein